MHSMGYQIALPCSLSRYATSAENHGGQMQHKEGGGIKRVLRGVGDSSLAFLLPVKEEP